MSDALIIQTLEAVNQMRSELTDHERGEESDISDIRGEIKEVKGDLAQVRTDLSEWRFAAEQRHHEAMAASDRRHLDILKALTASQDDLKAMRKAFVEVNGEPDYDGHRDDHGTRKRWSEIIGGWIRDGFGNFVKLTMASGIVWFLYQVWDALHKGPK